jgi:hypothetical protein
MRAELNKPANVVIRRSAKASELYSYAAAPVWEVKRGWNMSKPDGEVRRNQKTVKSADCRKLFSPDNYRFSTKAEGREETLYFENRATNQTGRLRQQHKEGPRARIDEKARTHLFLSKKRHKYLKRWHKENPCRVPAFCCRELRLVGGKYHVEFACEGEELRWHASKGIVKVNKNPKPLVRDALNKVCGAG